MRLLKSLLIVFFVSLFGFSSFGDDVTSLTILHMNDHHGNFWPNGSREGGLAAQATLINKIKNEVKDKGGYVLLLSAGDVNSGSAESNLFKAEPDFVALKAIGYDAMAVGNHEFDNDYETLRKQERLAGFPFLSANIYEKGTQRHGFTPYIIKNIGPLRVGILGLTVDNVPEISFGTSSSRFDFRDPVAAASAIIPELKKKSDLIIALTHIGYYDTPSDETEEDIPEGDILLARKNKDISVIVGGHSHTKISKMTTDGNTIIVQTESASRYLGRLDLMIEKSGKIISKTYSLLPINLLGTPENQRIASDEKINSLLLPFHLKAQQVTGELIGTSKGVWIGERAVISNDEMPVTGMVAFALKKAAKADLAVISSGLIRAGIPEGEVNYGHVLTVHPFGLKLVSVEFTGSELANYLNETVKTPRGSADFALFSGVKIVLDKRTGLIKQIFIKRDQSFEELDPNKKYQLATVSFVATGGNGYPAINNHPKYKEYQIKDADVLKNYIKEVKVIDPQDFKPETFDIR